MDELKKDDKVTIVESNTHTDKIKRFYGKELYIDDIAVDTEGIKLYKIKGVSDYALGKDLIKV